MPSLFFLFLLIIALLPSARGTIGGGGWETATNKKQQQQYNLLNLIQQQRQQQRQQRNIPTISTTNYAVLRLRGGQQNEETNADTSMEHGELPFFTFPPSWLTITTTGAMCTGFMCYNGLSLIFFPQKVMESYGIQPIITLENEEEEEEGEDGKDDKKGVSNQKKQKEEDNIEEEGNKTDVAFENKLLRIMGSMELGIGLLVYLTVLPKRDLFADWTLQQVIALSIVPRLFLSFGLFVGPKMASLFSKNVTDDDDDDGVDEEDTVMDTTNTEPPQKPKITLLSMNAPFLIFVLTSLIINPSSSSGWSAYPSIVAKIFSVLLVLEAMQFLVRPFVASEMYFQVDLREDDKKHARALTRGLANDMLTSSTYISCIAWNILGNNGPKIAGFVSLLYVVLLSEVAYKSKLWKLMDAKGPWVQNVHILISLVFATGFLLS